MLSALSAMISWGEVARAAATRVATSELSTGAPFPQERVPCFHAVYYQRFSQSFGKQGLMAEYPGLYLGRWAAQSVETGFAYGYYPWVCGEFVKVLYLPFRSVPGVYAHALELRSVKQREGGGAVGDGPERWRM